MLATEHRDPSGSGPDPPIEMNRLAMNGQTPAPDGVTGGQPTGTFTPIGTGMDIARPDLARKRRRRLIAAGSVVVAVVVALGIVVSRLEPASPTVDNPWPDTVKRGEMLRQVRGNGTLVPEQIQFVQAEAGGQVERILVQPGAEVEPETVILVLGNPDLQQQAFDAEWAVRAAEAELAKLTVTLESDRLLQESLLATLRSDTRQAGLDATADEELLKSGLVPLIVQQKSRAKADDLAAKVLIEERRLKFGADSAKSQVAVQEAAVAKLGAARDLKRRQVAGLQVRAGISGVLVQLGDLVPLQSGQRVAPNATLAKVVVPTKLKAEIKVAETLARDVTRGQKVDVDTRNGIVPGHVVRVDPAVQGGTVLVEVKLDGPLPKGARPDLSVDGTIEIERLADVLYVGRPVQAQADSTVGLFKVTPDGKHAVRVPVKLGRSSVSTVEILEGLREGDKVILSDMSQFDGHNQVKLN